MYVVCRVLLVVFCVLKEYTVRESFGVMCSAGVCFGMEERSAQGALDRGPSVWVCHSWMAMRLFPREGSRDWVLHK